jgi:hypothetical protein
MFSAAYGKDLNNNEMCAEQQMCLTMKFTNKRGKLSTQFLFFFMLH